MSIAELLAARRPGHALERGFHEDEDVYAAELERIWRSGWLFAAHSAELPEPASWVTFDLDRDSVILTRGADGRVRALANSCRHRGSRICDEGAGAAVRLVCPYHQWAYDLDGALVACGGLDRELALDRGSLGLKRLHAEEAGGLVFVSFSAEPPSFAEARRDLERQLVPQGIDRARVAAFLDYRVQANWKLVWENNRECWHCHVGHPEYIRANFDTASPRNPASRRSLGERGAALADALAPLGLVADHVESGLAAFPGGGVWWSANRTPNAPGYVTESLDGLPVAPAMGRLGRDTGTLRVRTLPNFWCHASSDHAVTTRLVPRGPLRTDIRVTWLVDREAVEGVDYELDRLMPFWQRTSEQDWRLCERNQAGVLDSAYEPGRYSPARERNVIAFVEWYAEQLGAS